MSLDTNFFIILEHAISRALGHLEANKTKGFWCDGISLSENDAHYSIKSVNVNRSVNLKAFVGKDGQTPYELTLLFGNRALSRYTRGFAVDDCIADLPADEWIEIDIDKKQMTVRLL